jgi:hypothetical protein
MYLTHPSAEKRAFALEIVDTVVPRELKAALMPLLADLSPAEQLRQLGARFPQRPLPLDQRLLAIIAAEDEGYGDWARACAAYAAQRTIPRATNNGGSAVSSLIEKVIILKSVSIFAATPDEILAEVAALLEEVEVPAGTTILRQGELGTSMYIIVDGAVRVHEAEHTVDELGQRDVFGEMALLDAEPRAASVTALADTRLLKLEQDPFYLLMEERNEVARGIIRVLSRHLRARLKDLSALRQPALTVETSQAGTLPAPHKA